MAELAENRDEHDAWQRGDIRPRPDPTLLTARATEAAKEELRREIGGVREVLTTQIHTIEKTMEALETGQRGIGVRIIEQLANLDRLIQERFLSVQQQFATDAERFRSIQIQFVERDARAEQISGSAKEAVATALQAAKEAVGAALQAAKEAVAAQNTASNNAILKSETSTDKRIDETVRLLNSTTGALDARIGAIAESSKNTMTRQEVEQLFRTVMDKLDGPTGLAMRLEGVIARGLGTSTEAGRNTQQSQWVIGALIGGIALLIALVSFFVHLKGGV